MNEFLRLDNICKYYNEKAAVDHLSLSVPKGAIYGIIGPNGAGKTTTIRMIMVTHDFKNRVGYLPEERGLYKKMTLNEIITFLAEIKGFGKSEVAAEIDGWLEKMSLQEYKFRKVEELSKGMQQKLQFITTLIHKPEMIILDELFSGLDPINIELIKGILLDQKRQGTTILFSTHVMEQAEKLCDFICLINKGQKVLDGKLADVKAKFGANTIQVDIEGDGGFARDIDGVEEVSEFNNYIELKLSASADNQAVLKEIASRVTVRRFELVEPSLYNIFIDVTKSDPAKLEEEMK